MTTHVSRRSKVDPNAVPVGLLTKTGLGTSLLMLVLALVDAVVGDKIDSDTKFLIASGIATTIATILSRAYQAGKVYAAQHGIDIPDQPLR